MPEPTTPKAFLSYAWTSDDYDERVLNLARRLESEGAIEVVFDKWDLEPGQSIHAFMERVVGDPSIGFVLALCNPRYAERADNREGGVGAETLIIAPSVYSDAGQTKFVPVIMARDSDGNAPLPIYLRGRLYFDLSDPAKETEEFQNLVRHLHGAGRGRPPRGPRPSYLDPARPELRTGRRFHVFKDTLTGNRPNPGVYLREYLDSLFRAIAETTAAPEAAPAQVDEWALEAIEILRPYRDEFVECVRLIARYDEDARFAPRLHTFFEELLSERLSRPPRHYDYEATAIAFVTWEMYLYTLAALLQESRFSAAQALFSHFHVVDRSRGSSGLIRPFGAIDPGFRLLDEHRKHRLNDRSASLTANLVQARATLPEVSIQSLMEADALCYLRYLLQRDQERWFMDSWYPRLLNLGGSVSTFPLFTRATVQSRFADLASVLGVPDREELLARWRALPDSTFNQPAGFWGGRPRYEQLYQIEQIGTRA